ncbi:hypothetical protein H312_03112 [Anncaliia algerae PRA339]|uniref:Uncharacterized protein n=1 Tax=Anncaliia algerae PRA339 TaxID=1288291 RepID=A0A059EX67_9MICR|nr:hypothetical protein H312_03112 [Anncaliia algerae PRA339]
MDGIEENRNITNILIDRDEENIIPENEYHKTNIEIFFEEWGRGKYISAITHISFSLSTIIELSFLLMFKYCKLFDNDYNLYFTITTMTCSFIYFINLIENFIKMLFHLRIFIQTALNFIRLNLLILYLYMQYDKKSIILYSDKIVCLNHLKPLLVFLAISISYAHMKIFLNVENKKRLSFFQLPVIILFGLFMLLQPTNNYISIINFIYFIILVFYILIYYEKYKRSALYLQRNNIKIYLENHLENMFYVFIYYYAMFYFLKLQILIKQEMEQNN